MVEECKATIYTADEEAIIGKLVSQIHLPDDYVIDVVNGQTPGTFEAWLYKIGCSMKNAMHNSETYCKDPSELNSYIYSLIQHAEEFTAIYMEEYYMLAIKPD